MAIGRAITFISALKKGRSAAFFFTVIYFSAGAELWADEYQWQLPVGFPQPIVPADNPMSQVKVELGRQLFYDPALSVNSTYSCSTCHIQRLAFTDGKARAVGVHGDLHSRSAMSLTNVAYNQVFGWASKKLTSLEIQALVPMFNTQPPELGLNQEDNAVINRLNRSAYYQQRFNQAFPGNADPISIDTIAKALAAFQRILISGSSPYDRFLFADDRSALSNDAKAGMNLFFSKRTHCGDCHGGINFSRASAFAGLTIQSFEFHNTAVYERYADQGLAIETNLSEDAEKFRAPSLRNIALTAPYMHDGSIKTLREVIEHYARGGIAYQSAGVPGDGSNNSYRSPFVQGFEITEKEKQQLEEFLNALTDKQFIEDPRFSAPE